MEHIWEASTTRTRTPPICSRMLKGWFRFEVATHSMQLGLSACFVACSGSAWRRLPHFPPAGINISASFPRDQEAGAGKMGSDCQVPKDWDEVGNGQCHLSLYVFTTSTLQVSLELHFEPVRMTSTLHYGARHSRHKGMKFYPTSRHRKQDKWAGKTSKARTRKLKGTVTYSHHFTILFHLNPVEFGDGEICIDLGCQINLSGMPAWLLHWWFSFPCQPPCPQFWVRKAMKEFGQG